MQKPESLEMHERFQEKANQWYVWFRTLRYSEQLASLKDSPMMLRMVVDPTFEMCVCAVRKNPEAVKYVPPRFKEIYSLAVMLDPEQYGVLPEEHLTDALYKLACRSDSAIPIHMYSREGEVVKGDVLNGCLRSPEKSCHGDVHTLAGFSKPLMKAVWNRAVLQNYFWEHRAHRIRGPR
jgi:hypothetical protein